VLQFPEVSRISRFPLTNLCRLLRSTLRALTRGCTLFNCGVHDMTMHFLWDQRSREKRSGLGWQQLWILSTRGVAD
jgi:hypothetical protein